MQDNSSASANSLSQSITVTNNRPVVISLTVNDITFDAFNIIGQTFTIKRDTTTLKQFLQDQWTVFGGRSFVWIDQPGNGTYSYSGEVGGTGGNVDLEIQLLLL